MTFDNVNDSPNVRVCICERFVRELYFGSLARHCLISIVANLTAKHLMCKTVAQGIGRAS